jgi:hypothetical protein
MQVQIKTLKATTIPGLHLCCNVGNLYQCCFHKEQFLLGFKEESLTLNLLISIAKNYTYKCKLKEKIPNIIELKYRIKNYYSLEQYIAIKNNNLKGFEKYWTPVKHVFPDV